MNKDAMGLIYGLYSHPSGIYTGIFPEDHCNPGSSGNKQTTGQAGGLNCR